MPFLIIYALFALATPVLVIALYIRYSKLQARMSAAEEETTRQAIAWRNELAFLKKQITEQHAAVQQKSVVAEPSPIHAPSAAPIPASAPAPPPPTPSVVASREVPAIAMPPAVTLPAKLGAPPVSTGKSQQPGSGPIAPAGTPTTEAVPPTKREEPIAQPPVLHPPTQISAPTVGPHALTPAEMPSVSRLAKPATPAAPPPTPSSSEASKAPTTILPAAASSPVDAKPATPPMAARVSVSVPTSPLRLPSAKATLKERMNKVSAFEEMVGTNWLQKLGIVLLVFGVASFGIYELAALGSFGKVLVSYLAGAALLGGGMFLEKRERYQILGRTLIGGGWSLLFFTTYAMHHVEAMRVLDSLVLDSALMLMVAGAMAAHTLRYRSQLVTGLAFLLGYSTVALSQDTVYSLSAGVILAIGLVAIVWKMEWYELEVFGILSSYLNHWYWLYRLLGPNGAEGHDFTQYHASTALLFFYWLTFRASYVFRRIANEHQEKVSTTSAILNTLLLLGTMRFQSVQPELAWIALLAIGALELSCALLPMVRKRRQAFVVLSVMGAGLMLAAPPSHYSGNNVAILWLVGTEVFLIAGIVAKEVVFRRIGLLTGLLVGGHLVIADLRPALAQRDSGEFPLVWAAVLFGLCAVVFYGNSLGLGRRWNEFFEDRPDEELLIAHSYLGAFAAAVAAWALCTGNWMVVAFAVLMLAVAALGRNSTSQHLQAQFTLLGGLAAYRTFAVNLHLESPSGVHVKMRLITLPLVAAAFYGTAKLAAYRDTLEQRVLRGCFAAAGSSALALLIWFEAPELWRPVAFIVFAIALAEAGRALKYSALAWHTHVVCVLAAGTALIADSYGVHRWHTMPVHAFGGLAVVAGFYRLAQRGTHEANLYLEATRAAYTWAAAGMMLWALLELLHAPWVAVGYVAFAVTLAFAARGLKYSQLAWQANVVAVCAALRTVQFNYGLEQKIWPGVGLRIVTVSLVAAGLYFISRRGAPDERRQRAVAFVHSCVATGLLAVLMFYEAPNGWLAPLWATFALVLALFDRKWESEELPWQAHILSLLTLIRAATFNLHLTTTWHGWSVRLLSLSLVTVIFYAMTMVVRVPEEWRERDIQYIYSWAASVLASLLLWYELQPLSVAVAWAAFGLILFEYGLLRKIRQFRYQAYIALVAAFTRIFFVNLTAGEPGEFWGPRLYTILPLALIFFLVYAQLPEDVSSKEEREEIARDRAWHVDTLLACLGTSAIVALLRFQFIGEWLVVAWAALVVLLFAVAWLLKRELFLYQGMALTLLTFARGVAHNLFGSGYFSEGDWQGRYVVVSAAVGLLLVSLVFAFQLRGRYGQQRSASTAGRILAAIVRRPEQLQFFAATVLLSLMLALKMRAGMVTVSWGIEASLIIVLALVVKERSFRLAGLGLLLLCVGKIAIFDYWGFQPRDRYITLMVVGSALLLVSYLYSRYRETIRQFL